MIEDIWLSTIIGGILTTLIYELGKFIILYLFDKRTERSLEFSIDGYWCSFVTSKSKKSKEGYSGCELLKLRYRKGYIRMEIFHLTNDGRKYYYKGIGFLRGNKIAIAYGDSSDESSNHVGTMILRYSNILEHQIALVGNYHEFKQNEHQSTQTTYLIAKYQGTRRISEVKKFLLRKEYIYSFMQRDEFINECEKMSKMR